MDPITPFATSYIDELRACLSELDLGQVERVADLLDQTRTRDRAVFVVGNGGSAATASHFASDLSRTACGTGRPGLRASCLTDNIAAFTAMANDTSFEQAFAEMLALQVREGDLVIAISGSGNSQNLLRAVEVARQRGAVTVGLVGFGGGALAPRVDHAVVVSSRHYGAVEDLHLMLGHLLSMHLAGEQRTRDPSARPSSSL